MEISRFTEFFFLASDLEVLNNIHTDTHRAVSVTHLDQPLFNEFANILIHLHKVTLPIFTVVSIRSKYMSVRENWKKKTTI